MNKQEVLEFDHTKYQLHICKDSGDLRIRYRKWGESKWSEEIEIPMSYFVSMVWTNRVFRVEVQNSASLKLRGDF